MQTHLSPEFTGTPEGTAAEKILRACVHCGFCNANCPTYQVQGDELDGPRGRIYLIKQMLEGAATGVSTQRHLDRCLTCLACQTTCPSGVDYGTLIGIGRELVEHRVPRPAAVRLKRWVLKEGLTSRAFAPALRLARLLRGVLPAALRESIPAAPRNVGALPARKHPRRILLLAGCTQPAMLPNINRATARVLDACGIETVIEPGAGCCGALREHLADRSGGLKDARRNIDAWWPSIENGSIEAIVMNASACGLAVKGYGAALSGDAAYAKRAARVSELARDLSELLPDLVPRLRPLLARGGGDESTAGTVSVHLPCTLQHGQRLREGLAAHLKELGFQVNAACADSHLCCGSAGTYSVLQPELSRTLRARKLQALLAAEPATVVSANVGCISHLQAGTPTPVRHWIELLDERIAAGVGT